MTLPAKRKNELTELQQNFLEALFGEADGDPKKAKELAGYADSIKAITIVRALRDEINEITMDQLAMNGPKAAKALTNLLSHPTTSGADIIIKAANQVLDRTGVTKKTEDQGSVKISGGGLFILPAKGAYIQISDSLGELRSGPNDDNPPMITLNEDEYNGN